MSHHSHHSATDSSSWQTDECVTNAATSLLFFTGRCLFGLRYLELMTTTPLILTAVGLLAGTTLSEIWLASIASVLMFGAQWAGVQVPTRSASWVLSGFSVLVWIPVLRTLLRSFVYDSKKHKESATLTSVSLNVGLMNSVGFYLES